MFLWGLCLQVRLEGSTRKYLVQRKKYGMISGSGGGQLLDSYRFNSDSAAILALDHRPRYESTSAANVYKGTNETSQSHELS